MIEIEEDDDNNGVQVTVSDELNGMRLDKALAALCPDHSRTRLKALIEGGQVTAGGKKLRDASTPVKAGLVLQVVVPQAVEATPQPENIPLDIVYEDSDLLVINKQAGLVVHPGAGNPTGTLVNALLYHCGDTLSGIGGVMRPGIVHRLDMETTGLMVVAKNDIAHRGLSDQLADRTLHRLYMAIVWRIPAHKGVVDMPIGRHPSFRQKMAVNVRGGREARTHYNVERSFGEAASLITCKLESGRTHQIRVHMTAIRHPLVGDPLYGLQHNAQESLLRKGGLSPEEADFVLKFPRQALHARHIGFIHPVTGEEIGFDAEPPADIEELLSVMETIN
ncbi:RluA family pseudouridine synthase [Micavibrio aeruginosavorus]|uniref:Pseudouridine synthase n=1 Tax=Micavibrio aeruginosavorus (strain ARL-13) TaxID=856793 RepID=G2KN10_MICAA|nr:RluA family pseudouridine synthase [Micavibrio aeruginosavorus]AEP08942.1 pseudouridine synthase, RluA family protein [Micavibrio aeruginosavorus ARL-13]